MPKRPRLARIRIGEVEIDVYDIETLVALLDKLGVSGNPSIEMGSIRSVRNVRSKRSIRSKKREEERDSLRKANKPIMTEPIAVPMDSSLPSFAQGNPWLLEIANKSDSQ